MSYRFGSLSGQRLSESCVQAGRQLKTQSKNLQIKTHKQLRLPESSSYLRRTTENPCQTFGSRIKYCQYIFGSQLNPRILRSRKLEDFVYPVNGNVFRIDLFVYPFNLPNRTKIMSLDAYLSRYILISFKFCCSENGRC